MIVPDPSKCRRLPTGVLALAALLGSAPAASAQLILHTDLDTSRTNTVHLSLGTTPGGTDRVDNEYVYAGPFRASMTGSIPGLAPKVMAPQDVYCVNLTANIGAHDRYAVTPGTTFVNGKGQQALNGHGALISAIAGDNLVPATILGGEARQLALWSALYNGAGALNRKGDLFTVDGADLKATLGLEPLVDSLLDRAAKGATSAPSQSAPVYYANGYGQDMVVSSPRPVQAVPEPSTFLMMGVGLAAALGLGARRRAAKAA